jgi:hypothetical protein
VYCVVSNMELRNKGRVLFSGKIDRQYYRIQSLSGIPPSLSLVPVWLFNVALQNGDAP